MLIASASAGLLPTARAEARMQDMFPDHCFLSLQAEITPELARSCPEKINLLFQVQLLGRSLDDVDAGLTLLIDLARDLVPYDRAALLWWDEQRGAAHVRTSRGFGEAVPAAALREIFSASGAPGKARPLLVAPELSPGEVVALSRKRYGAPSILWIPLFAADGVVGGVLLLRDRSPGFSREEAHLLRVFTFSFESVLEGLLQSEGRPDLSYSDTLTGLFNRRYYDQQLEREVERARRAKGHVSVLLVTIDDFYRLRQRYGRMAGETLLHRVSSVLASNCRKMDTLARFREESFALILPGAERANLPGKAERIFRALSVPLLAEWQGPEGESVSASVSGASYPDDGSSADALIELAVQGLDVARSAPGRHYYQPPVRALREGSQEALDLVTSEIARGQLFEPGRLLELFGRVCLDAVPADRVSIMIRDGDSLVIRVALGFDGREEVVESTRVPLNGRTVSAWVAQGRSPLLVRSVAEMSAIATPSEGAYRSDSFFSFPLLDGETLLGIVHFSNRSDGEAFTEADVEKFRPLAEIMSRYVVRYGRFATSQESFLKEALSLLVDLTETRVTGMERHSEEVARLARLTALELGYGAEKTERLALSSRLHDLGNVSLPSSAFGQPRALSPRERTMAQRHPLLGWRFLKDVPLGPLDMDAILYHHEREDGSGYFGKRGEETPESAKIVGVADVFQAITSPRPYRPAVSEAEGLSYLERQKGVLFDGRVVEALKAALRRA